SGGQQPRYAYTIGLSPKLGYELVFAGGILFMYEEVGKIVSGIIEQLTINSTTQLSLHTVDPFGTFSFRKCDPSWTALLLLGAIDFYKQQDVPGVQIVPDDEHTTFDVPDMTVPWNPQAAPIWQYLSEPWTLPVPPTSHAVTDLAALRGSPVTEACRWEEDYWELFAGDGPDVPDEEKRVVGLGMLLAADPSLNAVLDLGLGDGIWREDTFEWHIWETRKATE
ncbi:MAG: DUF4262 domain-containing protein, partial [Terracidiphilus sp.]